MDENGFTIPREKSWGIVCEFTQNENLRRHMLAVEAAMRAYAAKYGGDPELWGTVGLLHDFDYEQNPDPSSHPQRGSEILKERGYPEEVQHAILTHADYLGLPRQTPMEKALYACDELCGFIVAVALVMPGKKLAEVTVDSVKSKLKKKEFARRVSREDIQRGVEELGIPMEEHIGTVLSALQGIAGEIGL
jgi:putative nucleotidyltransferase with HDIG domain